MNLQEGAVEVEEAVEAEEGEEVIQTWINQWTTMTQEMKSPTRQQQPDN
jgi:hypothetical protein